MNRFLKTASVFLVALSMVTLPVTAQTDRNGGRQSHFSSGQSNGTGHKQRPSGNNGGGHHQGGGGSRPGNNGGGHRPGGNGNNNHHNRPGYGDNHHRPGGNGNNHHGGNYRPDHGHRPEATPPPPHRHQRPHRPTYYGVHHSHHVPFFGHYHRPTPPPAWRPAVYGPSFGTILGIAFGTTLDLTLRALLNQGYNVTGYGNNVVYLTNVPQMNFYWPDAALYYNNGALCGSSFTYPSVYYDMGRYNALYATFCGQYGMPISSVNQGGVISSTWFGNGNRYVTLEFNSNYGNYYTTLSFGI